MKNDVFEQCYQFNMKRKFLYQEMSEAYERTAVKVCNHFYSKYWTKVDSKSYHRYFDSRGYPTFAKRESYIKFIFWNNHPYWAWLLHEEFDDPDFLDCAKTVRKIAYTYRDLPTYTGLINYDMYQVAPSFC